MAAASGTIQLARGSTQNVSRHDLFPFVTLNHSRASSAKITIVPTAALLAPPSLAASVNNAYSADALTILTGIRSMTADTCFSAVVNSSVSLAAAVGEPFVRDSRSVALLFFRQSTTFIRLGSHAFLTRLTEQLDQLLVLEDNVLAPSIDKSTSSIHSRLLENIRSFLNTRHLDIVQYSRFLPSPRDTGHPLIPSFRYIAYPLPRSVHWYRLGRIHRERSVRASAGTMAWAYSQGQIGQGSCKGIFTEMSGP
jgi:hypothetical protein